MIDNVLGYVTGLASYIEGDDLVSMRRHERPESYTDSFVSCAKRVWDLPPRDVQLSFFAPQPVQEYQPQPGEPPELPESVSNTDLIGQELVMNGRTYIVESVSDTNVEMRDISTQGNVGFPVICNGSIDFVRKLLTEKEKRIAPEPAAPIPEPPQQKERNADTPQGEPVDFRITDEHLGTGGAKTKYAANIAAIRLLQALEEENRYATVQEQEVLSRYVGWGGIPQAFDEQNTSWANECRELRGLLSDAEYESARASTLNAHYTAPIVIKAMYEALENMGFQTGNILEPACGVGNFFGLVPDSMKDSKRYGVELDSVSGRIAQRLYPNDNITVQGYEKSKMPDNFFDVAIGNVPFGNYGVVDEKYDKHKFHIHDYFFAKTLDKVRPGGIVAFVTSKGTMDKKDPAVRKYIAQRAELLGAVRLPNNAFLANAGTEVTADILFLQKRDRIVEPDDDWVHLGTTENGIPVNSYFAGHPDMVLGEMVFDESMYGKENDTACIPFDDADLAEQLNDAILQIHAQITDYERDDETETEDNSIPANPTVRNYSYTVVDEQIYYRENSRMRPVETTMTGENRIKGMIGIRDCVRTLMELQTREAANDAILFQQNKLNRLYDTFTAKYGLLNSRANQTAFNGDSSYFLLCSLEILDETGQLERKADMFTKRTIRPLKTITRVDTSMDALDVSLSDRARVDVPYMAQLTEKDEETVVAELEGVIFRLPAPLDENQKPVYVTADEYLSGNVREKLIEAKRAAETSEPFAVNVKSLEEIQPEDLTATEISVRLGAAWIPEDVINQFMYELLDTPQYHQTDIKSVYISHTAEWSVRNKSYDRGSVKANSAYGTTRANAYKIIEETLNLRDVRIFDPVYDENGNRAGYELNKKETILAQQKQDMIKEQFKEWIWRDPDRRDRLTRIYNDRFNCIRPREYDGSHIRFVGMNPAITLRPHQVNAVARGLYGGNALLAHVVGSGKTYAMAALAQESKRLGLCSKSLFVVPNHIIEQVAGDYLQLYPSANILVSTKKDFEARNRKRFCGRIATGDYDAVIIGQSQFERIPMSAERQAGFLHNQIAEITAGINELKARSGERYTIKQLEKTRKSIQNKLEKLATQKRKDDVVTFEELGIDKLFVDEADFYKNLYLHTKMRNVAGISQTEAQKATDMFMKTQYLDELTGGRGVVFATGTPISNSMTELYTMTRFAKFYNLPELMQMFREVADIQTADMLDLPAPQAHYHNIAVKPSEFQKEMVAKLAERAELVRNGDVDPTIDNMLVITNDGRKLALDQRLMNDMLPDHENSKVNACVQNTFEIWKNHEKDRSAQLIFSDLSTPKNDGTFSVYDDIRAKLEQRGVPAEEIAFIHEAKSEIQKKELFAKVRRGQVRVLLGSTHKMGAGTNVQDRLIAIHDLDIPWRPRDLEQRAGRIVRQRNKNKDVHIYRYVTENTFDAYMYQLLESKQRFISQIMSGKSPVREVEDLDEMVLSYAEIKALATGNPHIKEKMDLDITVSRLKLLKANHLNQKYALEDKIRKSYPQDIKYLEQKIAACESDIRLRDANTPADKETFPPMTIGGFLYDKKADAGAALLKATDGMESSKAVELGSYRGFSMELSYNTFLQEFVLTLRGAASYNVRLGKDVHGNITRIDNTLEQFGEHLEDEKKNLANVHAQMETARTEVQKPFTQEQELKEKSARLDELNAMLNMNERGNEGLLDGQDDTMDEKEDKEKDNGQMQR